MKFIKNILINILFKLLGESDNLYEIDALFGNKSKASWHARQSRWKIALANLFRNKDLLNYFYYQVANDKERIFRNVSNTDMVRGARMRILFVIHQAQMAYLKEKQKRINNPTEKKEIQKEIIESQQNYNNLTKVKS